MTITLGVELHPQRPPRCYQSISKQHAKTMLIEKQLTRAETIQEVNRDHVGFLNKLCQTSASYFGVWCDDVQIHNPHYLKTCIALLGNNPRSAAGLPNWSLGTNKSSYPDRVWIARTRDCSPIEYDNLSDKTYSDAETIWLIDQGLNGIIVNADWNHWVPTNLTYLTTPGYVLEEYNTCGEHWANTQITLHTKPLEKLNIHPLLNPKP